MTFVEPDAEQTRQTAGMIALLPTAEMQKQLSLPDGEPVEDIHLTLAYFNLCFTHRQTHTRAWRRVMIGSTDPKPIRHVTK
ncbi:hypothetical protein [Prescottella agglutinans]|uniref:Uncharacterized protein n=1 Tax=Prescottella agglutinans TaxID=1644129 RepID=A0ABT6MAX8_9NOCA|nr:hypothetical protein [Prescottella agglutinans]MDH6281099.1 hypothetical protein [Prescottella agglutinans]